MEPLRTYKISPKHLTMVLGGSIGLAGAAAVGHWPNHAMFLQMTLYSIMALGLLFLGFWSDRHRARFWTVMLLALVSHGIFLYFIRSIFPFRTILVAIPLLFLEDVSLAIMTIKLVMGE